MQRQIKITDKLSIILYCSKFRVSFKFFEIVYDMFIDYSFSVTVFNTGFRIYYKNKKKQEALKKLYESLDKVGYD